MNEKNIGINLRNKRLELNMKQEDLAKRSKICTNYIGKIERGERIPKLGIFVRLLIALNASADEILSETPDSDYLSRIQLYADKLNRLNKS